MPTPLELRLDVGKSTIGTVTNVAWMMFRRENMSYIHALAENMCCLKGNQQKNFAMADRIYIEHTGAFLF